MRTIPTSPIPQIPITLAPWQLELLREGKPPSLIRLPLYVKQRRMLGKLIGSGYEQRLNDEEIINGALRNFSPGQGFYVQEEWQLAEWYGDHWEPARSEVNECQAGIYKKYHSTDGEEPGIDSDEWSWRPADDMPEWAARYRGTIREVTAQQLGLATAEQFRVETRIEGTTTKEVIGRYFRYMHLWQAQHGSYDPNQWTALLTVEWDEKGGAK